MIACRAERRRIGRSILAAAFLLTLAAPASAQQQPPLVQPFDPETMERMDPPAYENVGRIEADSLKAPNPEGAGTMDAHQGGFSAALWTGTSAQVVRALLPMLPTASPSATIRSLQRRLLLTAAPPPEGASPDMRPSLVELRVERLLAMGDLEGVAGLTSAAPASVEGSVAAKARRDAQLLAGKVTEACANLPPGGDLDSARLATFCHLAAGRTLEGNLALDLLRERQGADSGFLAAAEALAGLPPAPNAKMDIPELTPLHVALFRAARLPLPDAALANASPTLARALAGNEALSADQRIATAERAEAAGLMNTDDLRKLYLALAFPPDELAAPMDRAAAAGTHGRALLFRAAFDQPDPVLKARFTAKALELAATRNRLASTARVFESLIAATRPEPLLAREAIAMTRALFALGRPEAAAKWLDIALAEVTTVHEAEKLWPLTAAAAAAPGQPLAMAGLGGWRASLRGLPAEMVARRNAVVLGVLAALGAKVPDHAWLAALPLTGAGPRPALFAMMQTAALEARLGGTLLPSLVAMGETPLDRIDPITLSETISALAVVGLSDDARALAIEALLANGV